MNTTTLDTTVRVPQAVLFRNLGGEAILLNTESGNYFGLDGVGTRMWQSLADGGSVRATYATLLKEYDVAPERLQADLLTFIDRLCDKALLAREASSN